MNIKNLILFLLIVFNLVGCQKPARYEVRTCADEVLVLDLEGCISKCTSKKNEESFDTFEINVQSKTVLNRVYKKRNNEQYLGFIFNNCSIYDSENWHCKYTLDGKSDHLMINGIYIQIGNFGNSCGLKI
jgi:hypothetical protein